MVQQFGAEQVKLWRRSYDVPPPKVAVGHEYHPASDRRYRLQAPDAMPASECLKDVVARVLPWWYDSLVPQLRAGLTVLVVAHGNSLRALIKHLEGISDGDITELNVPTGMPRLYRFKGDLSFAEPPRYLDEAAARWRRGGQEADWVMLKVLCPACERLVTLEHLRFEGAALVVTCARCGAETRCVAEAQGRRHGAVVAHARPTAQLAAAGVVGFGRCEQRAELTHQRHRSGGARRAERRAPL